MRESTMVQSKADIDGSTQTRCHEERSSTSSDLAASSCSSLLAGQEQVHDHRLRAVLVTSFVHAEQVTFRKSKLKGILFDFDMLSPVHQTVSSWF